MVEDKYLRSAGIVPLEWTGFGADVNHFQFGGGLNLRGYSGYYAVQTGRDGQAYNIYKGKSGASASVELDTYLFADGGSMLYSESDGSEYFSDLRFDAGLGMALTIKRFWHFDKAAPLTIRADFPFLLSHTPNVSPQFVQFRWLIGLGRTF